MTVRRLAAAGALALVVLAGCARREPPPAPGPPVQPRPVPVPAPRMPAAADFVARAGSIDLFVIRSSELLLARSQHVALREYARQAIREHTGTSAQLSFAGRRLNLLPSVRLRPEHETMMRQLLESPALDRLYWRQQVTVHEESIDLHARFAARGQSPTLRPVAATALPIERRHRDGLRAMR